MEKIATEGPEAEKNPEKREKRAKKEKGREAYLTTFGARISKGDDMFKPIRDDSGSGRK